MLFYISYSSDTSIILNVRHVMPRLTPALMRAFDILELLGADSSGMTVGEIVESTGLPRTSVHELLNTLAARNYVRKDDQAGTYTLGSTLFRLGVRVPGWSDLRSLAQEYCRLLSDRSKETVSFAVLEFPSVVYIARGEVPQMLRLSANIGGSLPINCTAPGKAILSQSPDALARLLEEGTLQKLTAASIDDADRLVQEIATARERGYAFDHGEVDEDVTCVASPVFDATGEAIGSLSIAVPTSRWGSLTEDEWAELVLRAAHEMTLDLGVSDSESLRRLREVVGSI